MSATFRIEVERFPDAIVIPAEAVFDKGGRVVAYVLAGNRFEERAIDVARRAEGRIMVARGLKPGERLALKDPTLPVDQD
jgi:multidrug efflux pump subunit AcrA (membrane-fusion protein)